MTTPPLPQDEAERLAALRRLAILDSAPEERIDRITRTALRLFQVPMALVSLVDANRQWFKSCQGLSVPETPRSISFCGHAILEDRMLVIPDALADPRFADNPLVLGPPHIRFYAGFVVHSASGHKLGTLCLLDRQPRAFNDDQRAALADLGAMVENELTNIDLLSALAQAHEASTAKTQFLANMSHELRTPLNAIIGYSEMLREEAEGLGQSTISKDLLRISTAGRHLLGLINGVLDLAKIESGNMELHLEQFPLSDLLTEVVDTMEPLVVQRGNRLLLDVPPNLPTLRADLVKLRQVFFNLLSNANKFTEAGTITLRVRHQPHSGTFCFAVEDTGIGIAPEQQRVLFEPFRQADAATNRRYGGTGLGLSISERFVHLMGGEIAVESELARGSCFTIRLPATPPEERPLPPPPPPTTPRSVLVVDDDEDARDLITRFLLRDGYLVITARDGKEALHKARTLRPDAITLDIMMPGMTGWEVLDQLKADPALRAIPVIILTIVDQPDDARRAGVADFLFKPAARDRLLRALHAQFSSRPAPPRAP